MKRLLRGVVAIGDTISGEHLALNYKNLKEGFARGLDFGERPEDARIWEQIDAHYAEHDESPTIDYLDERIADKELSERLKDIAAAQPYIRSNYRELVNILTDKSLDISLRAAFKQAHEISTKKTRAEALQFIEAALNNIKNKSNPKTTLPYLTMAQVFEPLPPIPWLCEGLRLAPGGTAMLAGYGFSGKTIVAQHIALCVATGQPIFGIHPVRKGKVLHLDYEQGSRLTRERYQRLARGMGVTPDDIGDRLYVTVLPDIYLDNEESLETLANTVDGFDLVIIDSFKASCPNTEENASNIRIPLDALSRISEKTGVTPLIIDHARKPKEEASAAKFSIRGNSAKFDALTTVFVFQSAKDKPTIVEHEKCRHRGKTLPNFGLRVHDVAMDGNPYAGLTIEILDEAALQSVTVDDSAAALRTVQAKIIAHLSAMPNQTFGGSRNGLHEIVGGHKATFLSAIKGLEGTRRIVVESSPTAIRLLPEAEAAPQSTGPGMQVDDDVMQSLLDQVA